MYQESLANAKVSARQPWYVRYNSLNHPSLAFFTVTPYSDIKLENSLFSSCTLPLFDATAHAGETRQNFWIKLIPQKLQVLGCSVVKVARPYLQQFLTDPPV